MPAWWIWRLLGRGPERDTAEHFGRLDDYARNVVRELRANIARGEDAPKVDGAWDDVEARKSFVGLFLQDPRSREEDLSEDHLRDLVLNFLIAGRDTTARDLVMDSVLHIQNTPTWKQGPGRKWSTSARARSAPTRKWGVCPTCEPCSVRLYGYTLPSPSTSSVPWTSTLFPTALGYRGAPS